MDFELGFSDFRGFHQQTPVPIRPITILVGENSSGKSSFLAGLKYIRDFFQISGEPSFNGDPFQLGTFEQIAHNRGGRAGRAREFKIRMVKVIYEKINERDVRVNVDVSLVFGGLESRATLVGIEVKIDRTLLKVTLENGKFLWDLRDSKNQPFDLGDNLLRYGGMSGPSGHRFLSFALRDLQFIFRRGRMKSDEDGKDSPELKKFTAYLGKFLASFDGECFASSAIRFKPLRTYTPGIEAEDGEGSHVPFEMAKLARKRDKTEWRAMQQQLVAFGNSSNMFHEIDVKSFGQTASDPFQVQFSSSGPKMNLVDLGYGTSQVLPIIFNSSKYGNNVDFLIQQPEVHLHPKAQAALGQFFVDANLQKRHSFVLETHSDFIVDRVRLSIANGSIKKEDVSILFFERQRLENKIHLIRLDTDGEPINPPRTYREFFLGEQIKILGL